jgi:hypothetical protein
MNLLSSFFIIGMAVGIFFAYLLPFIFEFLFPRGYTVDRLDFMLIWIGNMFYWGRRLLGDIYIKLIIDKWIGISEIVGTIMFIVLLELNTPSDLYQFSVLYFISLLTAFVILFYACSRKFKLLI